MDKRIQTIKKLLERNWYINDISKNIVGKKYNNMIKTFVSNISDVDSIDNIEEFEEMLQQIPPTIWGSSHTIKRVYGENCLYGYASELLRYSGVQQKDLFYCPLLEHGISYNLDDDFLDTYRFNVYSGYIFQGRYKENIWKKYSKKPAYFIGPYIHYADNYYSVDAIKKIKKANGKTLLVFPPHSTEIGTMSFESSMFNRLLLDHFAQNYKTVIACIYWQNLTDDYTKFLKKQGVQLVSAGFKLDNRFVKRLKTILSLSDDVLYPSFNSSIGYAYYLGKNIFYAECDDNILYSDFKSRKENIMFKNNVHGFGKAFALEIDRQDKQLQDQLIEKYWGLSEIKSPEEIKRIILENKLRIRRSLGF